VCETSRDVDFSGHTFLTRATLVVEDARADSRYAQNPLVLGEPHIRFYAGAQIRDSAGLPLGTLCLIDQMPRPFGAADERRLMVLADLVRDELVPDTRSAASRARGQLAANVDPLTKVRWQRGFYDTVDQHIEQHGGAGTRFVVVRINNLTYLSSVFGRPVGDEILVEITNRLESVCRAHSQIRLGRLSGRRFGVFLSDCPPGSSSIGLKCQLVSVLSRPVDTGAGAVSPDIHIGVADGDVDVTSCQDGVERCYVALSSATETRGVVSAVFQAEGRELLRREHRIAADLKRALGGATLDMFYQPKVDAGNSRNGARLASTTAEFR
ncbi:MAG: diguanylate cyclase, partial [Pseudomonadota bacterium]